MNNQNPIINNAIQANMNAMRDMLEKAATLAQEGCGYMDDGNRNAAIGSIIDLIGCLTMPKPYLRLHSPSTGSEASALPPRRSFSTALNS